MASRKRRIITWALVVALAPVLGLIVFIGSLAFRAGTDPTPVMAARKGTLARATVINRIESPVAVCERVRLVSSSGLEVELRLRRPRTKEPLTTVVLIGGHATGSRSIELIPPSQDVVVAALSYPFEGDGRVKGFDVVRALPRLQAAIRDTVPATGLVVEYLIGLPFVDAERLEYVGVSLGAIFGPAITSFERRFRRTWIVHGAGELAVLINSAFEDDFSQPLRGWIVALTQRLVHAEHFAPERWAGSIASDELVFINTKDDERMPIDSILALHVAAREPKEIIWIGGQHVEPHRRDELGRLIDVVFGRIEDDARAH